MAKLIMKDGTEKETDYNVAAKVYQIMIGNEKPKDEKQRKFVDKVQGVKFENDKKVYSRSDKS